MNDFVCGKASQWVHNGTELCHAAGFAVKDDAHIEETLCYGSKASLDLIADSWKASRSAVPQKGGGFGLLDDFQQWVAEMPFNDRVSWAVGGMVLTAGLLFLRSVTFLLPFQIFLSKKMIIYAHVCYVTKMFLLSICSKRKSYSQRQKLAAIQRTARKLENKMSQQHPGNQRNKKAR